MQRCAPSLLPLGGELWKLIAPSASAATRSPCGSAGRADGSFGARVAVIASRASTDAIMLTAVTIAATPSPPRSGRQLTTRKIGWTVAAKHRWKCPLCDSGVLASSRPRLDDVKRYCLKCSEKTGRLVKRVCPTLDAKRRLKTEKRAAKRQTEAQKRAADPAVKLRKLFNKWKKWKGWTRSLANASLTIRRSNTKSYSSGHCWTYAQEMTVTMGTDFEDAMATLIHEMTHAALPPHEGHGDRFLSLQNDAMIALMGRPAKGARP